MFTAMLSAASTIKMVCAKTSGLSEQNQSKSAKIGWEYRIAQILKMHKITIEHISMQKARATIEASTGFFIVSTTVKLIIVNKYIPIGLCKITELLI